MISQTQRGQRKQEKQEKQERWQMQVEGVVRKGKNKAPPEQRNTWVKAIKFLKERDGHTWSRTSV